MSSQTGYLSDKQVFGPHLLGARRVIGIAGWGMVLMVSLIAFILAILSWNQWDRATAAEAARRFPNLTADDIRYLIQEKDSIHRLGLTLPLFADFFSVMRVLAGIPYFVLSAMILWRRSDRLMAVLFAIFLTVVGASGRFIDPNWRTLGTEFLYPWMNMPVRLLTFILNCSVIVLYTFPDGRFVPRWTRWFALFAVIWNLLGILPDNFPFNPYRFADIVPTTPPILLMAIGVFALVYRYRRDATMVQKQQLKWFVACFMPLLILYFVHFFTYEFPLTIAGSALMKTPFQDIVFTIITEPLWYVSQAVFALAIGIAVFR